MQMYANLNKDQIALGTIGNQMQEAYAIWYGGGAIPLARDGRVLQHGPAEYPEVYYCPSDTDYYNAYNSSQNPGSRARRTRTCGPHTSTAGGAGPRSGLESGGQDRPPTLATARDLRRKTTTAPDGWYVIDENNKNVQPFPKLGQFKNKALLADIFRSTNRIDIRHKQGINVYYSNGEVDPGGQERAERHGRRLVPGDQRTAERARGLQQSVQREHEAPSGVCSISRAADRFERGRIENPLPVD